MKHFIEQTTQHQSHADVFEEELQKMKMRIEETYRDMQKKMSQGLVGSKDIQQLSMNIDSKIAEIEEKLNEKANK